jgi:hypothetical protein
MSNAAPVDWTKAARWQGRALWTGAVAIAVCAVVASFRPAAFFRAYLAAYLFYLGIALGSMVLLMAYHLTGGSWGLMIRRILEAGMKTLPLLALLFVPIAAGVRCLYIWAQPEAVAASPKLQYQQFYLQPMLFCSRAVAYFVLWLALAFLLSRWSRQEDRTGNPRLTWKCLKLSGVGAVVYGISFHFAAVDWAMSLQPAFHSTIWGPTFAVGQLLSAFCFALIVLSRVIDRTPLAEVASLKVRNDLGSLLLTLLILWAYMVWFQFMLVWIANLPVDIVWYLPRASLGWKAVIVAVAVFHFAIPFFLLLMRPIKQNSRAMTWIAGLILFMQLVFMYYQTMPGLADDDAADYAMGALVPIGLGGIWLAHLLWQLQRQPLLPLHDCNREAALHLRHLDEEEAAREEGIVYG